MPQHNVLERIADAGLSPDSITYGTLLNAYARGGLLDELEQVRRALLVLGYDCAGRFMVPARSRQTLASMTLAGIEANLGARLAQLAAMAMHGDIGQANHVCVADAGGREMAYRTP